MHFETEITLSLSSITAFFFAIEKPVQKMLCSRFLMCFALCGRLVLGSDRSHSCEIIGMDFQDLLLNEYLHEVQTKKKQTMNNYIEPKEEKNTWLDESFLKRELHELREAMMNTTLKSKFYFTTLDRTGSNVPMAAKINIQLEVEKHYNAVKNLKVALWRQLPFLSPADLKEMNHASALVDVAFFLLLMRCLLPHVHR